MWLWVESPDPSHGLLGNPHNTQVRFGRISAKEAFHRSAGRSDQTVKKPHPRSFRPALVFVSLYRNAHRVHSELFQIRLESDLDLFIQLQIKLIGLHQSISVFGGKFRGFLGTSATVGLVVTHDCSGLPATVAAKKNQCLGEMLLHSDHIDVFMESLGGDIQHGPGDGFIHDDSSPVARQITNLLVVQHEVAELRTIVDRISDAGAFRQSGGSALPEEILVGRVGSGDRLPIDREVEAGDLEVLVDPVSEVAVAHSDTALLSCTQLVDHSNALLNITCSGESLCPVQMKPRRHVGKHDLAPDQIVEGDPRGLRIVQEEYGAVTPHRHSVKLDSRTGNTAASRLSNERTRPVQ